MTRSISFQVHGLPAAQGSKRHVGNGVMIESSKAVKPWRQDVVAAAIQAIAMAGDFEQFTGPVLVRVEFFFPRPKSHFGTGRNANVLKDNAPVWVGKKPDIDKTLRSTFDALTTAGIWRDDSLAAVVYTSKRFNSTPMAVIELHELLP